MNNQIIVAVLAVLALSVAGVARGQETFATARGVPASTQATPSQSQNPAGQQAADDAARTARRFGFGAYGGVGLDPELIDIGAHVRFGPLFKPNFSVRPGLELGAGEITTFLAINIDALYSFSDASTSSWTPYVGAGPTFGLSHRGFEIEDNVIIDNPDDNRFDFSDTDFNTGMNFIVGMRKPSGVFFEMKATAWGVSNIRLVAGFDF